MSATSLGFATCPDVGVALNEGGGVMPGQQEFIRRKLCLTGESGSRGERPRENVAPPFHGRRHRRILCSPSLAPSKLNPHRSEGFLRRELRVRE